MKTFGRSMMALLVIGLGLGLAACAGSEPVATLPAETEAGQITLAPVSLADGARLQVVATTTLVADVVANVGGDLIDLTTLLPTGADPHAFSPTPQDLRAVAKADVIFINGLGLELFLDEMLTNAGGNPVIVSVSDGIDLLALDETTDEHEDEHEDEHDHEEGDPHVWFSVANVRVWTANIAQTLSELDPAHVNDFARAAQMYDERLAALDQELHLLVDEIPAEQRKLVSDHHIFSYLARDYGFETAGSVVTGFSTLAQPSAQELAALQDQVTASGVKAIFVGTTVNSNLSARLAQDLGITLIPIYTGSLSPMDGPAATYIDFMRYNVETIANALK